MFRPFKKSHRQGIKNLHEKINLNKPHMKKSVLVSCSQIILSRVYVLIA